MVLHHTILQSRILIKDIRNFISLLKSINILPCAIWNKVPSFILNVAVILGQGSVPLIVCPEIFQLLLLFLGYTLQCAHRCRSCPRIRIIVQSAVNSSLGLDFACACLDIIHYFAADGLSHLEASSFNRFILETETATGLQYRILPWLKSVSHGTMLALYLVFSVYFLDAFV